MPGWMAPKTAPPPGNISERDLKLSRERGAGGVGGGGLRREQVGERILYKETKSKASAVPTLTR
jgi:hypothetical protein